MNKARAQSSFFPQLPYGRLGYSLPKMYFAIREPYEGIERLALSGIEKMASLRILADNERYDLRLEPRLETCHAQFFHVTLSRRRKAVPTLQFFYKAFRDQFF